MNEEKEEPIVVKFRIEMFQHDIIALFCDPSEAKDYISNSEVVKSIEASSKEYGAVTLSGYEPDATYIFFQNVNNTPAELAHEAIHAAHGIFNRIGFTSTQDNDEMLAYLVGYIVQNIQVHLRDAWVDKKKWKRI